MPNPKPATHVCDSHCAHYCVASPAQEPHTMKQHNDVIADLRRKLALAQTMLLKEAERAEAAEAKLAAINWAFHEYCGAQGSLEQNPPIEECWNRLAELIDGDAAALPSGVRQRGRMGSEPENTASSI